MRAAIPVSSSHPSMNRKHISALLNANYMVASRRKNRTQQIGYNAGNCEEYSSALWGRLADQFGPHYADVLYVESGDHALVLFDLDKKPNALSLEYSKNSVMCDPLLGNVWPCFASFNYLSTFRCLKGSNGIVNAVTSFNENYHSLVSFKDKSKLSFFRLNEQDESEQAQVVQNTFRT